MPAHTVLILGGGVGGVVAANALRKRLPRPHRILLVDREPTLEGAIRLRAALENLRSGRVLVLTAAPAYKCPAAPYEAAMLIDALLRKRGVRRTTQVELHSAEPGPMGVAGPEVSAAVRAMVEEKGIAYRPDHQISRAEAGRVTFTDGATVHFDLLVHVPPIAPPPALHDSGLTDESGWVRVDRHTLQTAFPEVYAVGDVTLIPLAMGKPLPRAGVFAHAQAAVVGRNIAAAIAGKHPPARFDGRGACFVETGGGKAGFGSGNFYAEPWPAVRMRRPAWYWHAGKVLFEKQVMWGWL